MDQPRIPRGSVFRHGLGRTVNRLSRGGLHRAASRCEPLLVHRTVHAPGWPRELDGFTIGHVSDFHIGELLRIEHGLAAVERLLDHPIDLLAVTGDIIDFHPAGVEPLLERLAAFPAPLGVWSVLGNHDKLVDPYGYLRLCERAGLNVLINNRIELKYQDAPLTISGIDWARRQPELDALVQSTCAAPDRAMDTNGAAESERGAHLLLAHNPLAFDMAASLGVHVTLSGHTHGGQLNLLHPTPQRRALGLSSVHRYAWGVYQRHGCALHVTSGAGSWFPFRVRCPSEVVVVTVTSAESAGH